jgi:hypothetical protein
LGSLEASLPVVVAASRKEVWTLLVFGLTCPGKASEYVFLSFDNCLQSKINPGNLLPLNAKSSKTDALVANPPFLVFFKPAILRSL